MELKFIFALFALFAIVEGQWAATARGLYQPIALSIGAVFTVMNSKSNSENGEGSTSAQAAEDLKEKFFKNAEEKALKEGIEVKDGKEKKETENLKEEKELFISPEVKEMMKAEKEMAERQNKKDYTF